MKKKMVTAVRYDDINGKTVSGAGYGFNTMLIAFTDGTVLALSVASSADDAELDFEQRDIDLMGRRWLSEAHEAELISDDEYKAARSNEDTERIKKLEAELALLKGTK